MGQQPVSSARSSRADVRNPILALPAAKRISQCPPEARRLLADLLYDIHLDARQRANDCWTRHKAPMALYWKAVSVYAGHLYRVVRP
ncbi:hypothetical protein EN829_014915 [Mesorhizobium sp. M00.F.Ca.ET.186.01.1.1]|nr:hypothetical protein EN848_14520 [bacterium M00.F.Ca.ET.205.01.1.1]TGU53188.1 hypothetical protein EN795_14875 [bacterium M00.F.Ca.ET.152.01.1.1]TGV36165.1 hypothetical protein EN829_014915 [Mesorhizobium sp. M00.F.Ca.ET.186.01.1.1]TGZ43741.1 hypothetical protein EN805_10485 [bacterium M00.F.Ca.ET.162.01.1.1]